MAGPDFLTTSHAFLANAARVWQTYKKTENTLKPILQATKDFDLVGRAALGELGADNSTVERVRVFVKNQKARLAEFAQRDENYWAFTSGADIYQQIAMRDAKSALDEWLSNFTGLRAAIQQFLPVVTAAQAVLNKDTVIAARMAIARSSLPGLDSIALTQIVGDLNGSLRSLDLICARIRNCRNSSWFTRK
jgi:hypothetical protein